MANSFVAMYNNTVVNLKDEYMNVGDKIKSLSCGEYVVTKINDSRSVLVRFLDTGYEVSRRRSEVKSGSVKDPLCKNVLGVGCVGVGKYGSRDKAYQKWFSMLRRCYLSENKSSSYFDCTVCDEWLNYQNFAEWLYSQADSLDGLHLDKDKKVKGNRVYAPEFCSLITEKENLSISRKVNSESFKVLSPEGEEFTVVNISQFCKPRGFDVGAFARLKYKTRKQYKGWRLQNA